MKTSLRIAGVLLASLLFHSINNSLKAQVKIGGNPAIVDKNAILELESVRKGLLLPRLTDAGFQTLNTNTPIADGLLIYLTATSMGFTPGFYVRENNSWKRIDADGSASTPWRTNGNDGAAGQWLGTKNLFPLNLRTNNTQRMGIDGDGNFTFAGASYVFNNVTAAAPTENDVLIINSSGQIFKKTLNNVSVTSLQDLSGDLDLAISSSNTHTETGITTAGQVISLNLPVMADAATQQYGFITAADFDKLQKLTSAGGLTFADVVTDNTLGDAGGKFEWDAANKKWTLTLNAAGETHAGVVTTTDQTFAGNKTFLGNVILGDAAGTGEATVNSVLALNKADFVDPAGPETEYNLLLKNATNQVQAVTVPKWKMNAEGIAAITIEGGTPVDVTGSTADGKLAFEQVSTGTDFTIKNSGSNKIVFEMPSASETNRGLVTAGAQDIGGVKTFKSEIVAGSAAGNALNIQGGVTVKQRAFTGGTVGVGDYVLLVKGSGSSVVSADLPAAAANAGKVYIFNRLPQESVDPADEANSTVRITDNGGATVAEIDEPYTSLTILSDGTKWIVMSRNMAGL
ncbi:hypothetical protein [Chitinophaga alhagiae]|uniref:hypothetical protein n=1 Tax=Chitinophaga alhagiae TaxID=2203219 RepID=UPI0013005933|nr:hypothetical protein [Chitinophaga alhagiae]